MTFEVCPALSVMPGNRTARDDIMKVIKLHKLGKNNREIAEATAAKDLKETNPKLFGEVSIRTIQEDIQKRLNYSKMKARVELLVTAKQRRRRVQFAKDHKDWNIVQSRKVLWNDESTFCVNESKGTKVWKSSTRSSCDPRLTVTSVKHPPYLMVWGALSYGGLGNFVILLKGQPVNSDRYINFLRED
ncbi:uncharacterized protein LOC143026034 [Oratosquilla oratoria]|uniref:uncharacterized protein LOC143026034 n=1 Tax=Oratosquilla oratoria TaxID=337810 RepID=UPI003F761D85